MSQLSRGGLIALAAVLLFWAVLVMAVTGSARIVDQQIRTRTIQQTAR